VRQNLLRNRALAVRPPTGAYHLVTLDVSPAEPTRVGALDSATIATLLQRGRTPVLQQGSLLASIHNAEWCEKFKLRRWSPAAWAAAFQTTAAWDDSELRRVALHELRKLVIQYTFSVVWATGGRYTTADGQEVRLETSPLPATVYALPILLRPLPPAGGGARDTLIRVVNQDCLVAAKALIDRCGCGAEHGQPHQPRRWLHGRRRCTGGEHVPPLQLLA